MSGVISIKKAALINASAKYTNVIFQFVATAVLARLLSPECYGLIAVITVFSVFFTTFSDIGLSSGVVQNKALSKLDVDNIFSFSFYLSLFLGVLFALASYPIAWFYEDDVYVPIGLLMSVSLFFNALSMIPNACLMREKRFKMIGLRTVCASLVSYGIAIFLAFQGYEYYSLVIQSIIFSLITFFWNVYVTQLSFIFKFDFTSVKKIIGYSSFNFGYDFLNYFVRNVDSLLTGKLMGKAMLGYYHKAYSLMLYPVMYLTFAIVPVLHPILSDHQDDREYIWSKYLQVVKCLSLVGMFVSFFCFIAADEIVNILYGPNWDAAIPCVKCLSFSIWFQMLSSSCDSIYKSIGKSKLLFNTALVFVAVQLVIIVLGALSCDLKILSMSVATAFILKFFISTFSLSKYGFNKNILELYFFVLPEFVVYLFSFLVMTFCLHFSFDNMFLSFVYKFIMSLIMFAVGYFVFNQYSYLKKK